MTKVITRYFDRLAAARLVRKELLHMRNFPRRIVHVFENADDIEERLAVKHVLADTAKAYKGRLANGGAVVLVEAGYKPLGVAKITREVAAQMGAADLGDIVEEVRVKDDTNFKLSVDQDHSLILSRFRDPDDTNYHMANWPIPLISRRKPFRGSLLPHDHAHMANWPISLISKRKPFTGSIFSRHARMANFPIPLISKRKPADRLAFPRHARMANFPIPLISKRKPYTGSIFARHARMANWPFPHLINGKQGTNALMPGGPRMANFPISLLSDRKPYTGSIFSPHARMANFPISLISKRKPFTGSIFSRHARMANMILPLVSTPREFTGRGVFGLPTLSKR